ncbi:F-box/LRR-repeat protein 3 [Glycine max]|nr:F-box/LRR-repeat protein 3 [Glycine max]
MTHRSRLDLSWWFTGIGLLSLNARCEHLVELSILGVAAMAHAQNLRKLWLARCKMVTNMGIGCIVMGCKKLKLIFLKWCVGIGDLVAIKCKELTTLDLSYFPHFLTTLCCLKFWAKGRGIYSNVFLVVLTWHFLLGLGNGKNLDLEQCS